MRTRLGNLIPQSPKWRLLLGALVVSSFGDQFTRIALYARVSELEGGVSGLALLAAVEAFGAVIGSTIGGPVADRGSGPGSLALLNGGRALSLLVLAASSSLGVAIAIAGVLAFASGMYAPIEGALEPGLLDDNVSELARANALRGVLYNLMTSVGPAAAGFTIGAFGSSTAFTIDAITFFAALVFIMRLRLGWTDVRHLDSTGSTGSLSWREQRAGFALAASVAQVRHCLIALAIITLILGFHGPAIFDLVDQRFDNGPLVFGVDMAVMGAGSVVGSVLIVRGGLVARGAWVVYAAMVVDGAALGAFVLFPSLIANLVTMFVMGGISAVAIVIIRHTVQSGAPEAVRGRGLALMRIVDRPLIFVSLGLFAVLLNFFAVSTILFASGCIELAAGLIGLAVFDSRKTEQKAPQSAH